MRNINITEATKKALQSGRGITRPDFIKNTKYGLWFLPTKSTLGYLIIDNKEITPLQQTALMSRLWTGFFGTESCRTPKIFQNPDFSLKRRDFWVFV
ncbi:hypothetical protein [Leuconostoc mesenteroides]|uniref:hypothetical protein n=2 Tax=Leuconostoc mesenteroides TaxID=1245 RepID=UPI0021A898C9|nr:hypothetical protein [Leuconostoc mesenteroides]MCT3046744.1 hypothetical protein [Leuconostoc mesenteroides]